MHTINDLRTLLGLNTTNQVRNRIEAIKDVLAEHLRRGPNNQILVSDAGVELLRRVQELYDSGLTLTEASGVIRSSHFEKRPRVEVVSPGMLQFGNKPHQTDPLIAALREEIAYLRQRVAFLEERRPSPPSQGNPQEWWEFFKEEVDGA